MEYITEPLYIQIRDGKPYQFPIIHTNFIQAFPDIDPNNLPLDRFARFFKTDAPIPGPYETYEGYTYEWVGDVVKEVHHLAQMSDEDKLAKQNTVKNGWAARPQADNWSAWTFDETTCAYVPPVPRPDPVEGKTVLWCGAENNWKEAPSRPQDGKTYMFNFTKWDWDETTPDFTPYGRKTPTMPFRKSM